MSGIHSIIIFKPSVFCDFCHKSIRLSILGQEKCNFVSFFHFLLDSWLFYGHKYNFNVFYNNIVKKQFYKQQDKLSCEKILALILQVSPHLLQEFKNLTFSISLAGEICRSPKISNFTRHLQRFLRPLVQSLD